MQLILTANPKRPHTEEIRARLKTLAESLGIVCFLYDGTESEIPDAADAFLVVGGDGSLIRVAHEACRRDIPLFGVHAGRVGFLTELTEQDAPEFFSRLLSGDYRVESRAMLAVSVNGGAPIPCLNDVLVYKHSFSGVTQLDVKIDQNAVGTLFGDGIIVATPTGATGYSLSAGGPIVSDGLDAMLITPVCPHTLHIRPIVASLDSTVTLTVSDDCFAAADGDHVAELHRGDCVTVSRSALSTKLITFGDRNPFRLIAEKLN